MMLNQKTAAHLIKISRTTLRKKYIVCHCMEPCDTSMTDGKTLFQKDKSTLAYIQIIINVVQALCCESTSPTDAGMDTFLAADREVDPRCSLKDPKGLWEIADVDVGSGKR